MACWWRPMAARGVCLRPYAATMRRSPETGGRSRRRRDGLFAKEHGGETTKLSGSSRDVHDYLRALACSRHQRVAVPVKSLIGPITADYAARHDDVYSLRENGP